MTCNCADCQRREKEVFDLIEEYTKCMLTVEKQSFID
jgi:hypothetical protein